MTVDRDGPRDPRFAIWIGSTVAMFAAAIVVGFVWLPAADAGQDRLDLWASICRAVGLPVRNEQNVAVEARAAVSAVAWTAATRRRMSQGSAIRGAALATTCNGCHGAKGISSDAIFPNLVGQSVASLYKQLEDFKTGKRYPAVMGVYVTSLSTQDLVDIATHFAAMPSVSADARRTTSPQEAAARRLVEVGDPSRGIAACSACHGPLGLTTGAPGLLGQQKAYLEVQLQLFAAGMRHNDISAQMRSVARQLTSEEIAQLAGYYSGAVSVPGQ
jgi:cytochrome c553